MLLVYIMFVRPKIKTKKDTEVKSVIRGPEIHESESINDRKEFKMNESEQIIIRSKPLSIIFNKGGFFLTNQRLINVERSPWGSSSTVRSFSLENLDSILNESKKPVGCLFIGILFIIGAIFLGILELEEIDELREAPTMPALFAGLVFFISIVSLITYFFSRQRVIKLTSGRSEIILNVRSLSFEKIQEIVFEIEQAKQNRLERQGKDISIKETDFYTELDRKKKSAMTRLQELDALRSDGLISEEEYNAKRKGIIDEL